MTYKKETAIAVLTLCRRPRKDVVILPTKKSNGDGREACPKKVVEFGSQRKQDKMQMKISDQADLPLKEG